MNNTASNVTTMNAMLEAYIRAGFVLVPILQGKGPVGKGWNEKKNCITTVEQINPSIGYGLAHAYSNTMALDIDDWAKSAEVLKPLSIDLTALAAASDSVMIDSGNPGHAKFLFRLPVSLPSKKLIIEGQTIYELRSATASGLTVQDVLPSAVHHPKTHQQYRWAGQGHFNQLPVIPDALLTHWESMIDADKMRNIDMGETIDASWEDIQSAVEVIPADCSRDEWIRVGMALHYAGSVTNQLDQALYIWNDWSKQSESKYPGERGIYSQWLSFKTDKASSAKLGTLFHYAKQHGWTRPPIDVTALFQNAGELAKPEQVLKRLNPPAPRADLSLFPEVLATRAEQIGTTVGCDPMVPLWAGLAAVCGVADSESRLELMDGFQVPPVLWLMTIGEPADKKTPGSTPMFTVLAELEHEDRPHYKKKLLDWEGQEAMYAAAHKAFIQFSESPDALLGGQAPQVPDLPPQPVPLRIKVSDVTSQKLVRLTADRPRGLLCHLDEMAGWVRKVCDRSSGEDRSAWTEAYECKSYHMDRVGAGTILAENHAVAIYGNIQPRVLRESISALSADGLLQRFIPVVLDGSLTRKPEPLPAYMRNDAAWQNALRVVYSLPPMVYRLSPEAFTVYREFQDWYDQRRADERLLQSDEVFMTAFGKLEGLVGRIALVFHMLECPFDLMVSGELMRRAVRFAQSYLIPAYRAALCDIGGSTNLERWVHDWIIQHADKETVTMSDIKRAARRQLDHIHPNQHDARVMVAMIPLEDAAYVMRIDDMTTTHRAQWAINPVLINQHADYRREVINAKQRQLDEIYKLSPNEKPKAYGNK